MCASWYAEVPPADFSEKLHFTQLWAVPLPPRLCSQALQLVSADAMREEFPWLKRLAKLPALTDNGSSTTNTTPAAEPMLLLPSGELPAELAKLLTEHQSSVPAVHTVQVAAHPPLTKAMAEAYNKVWPVTYRQPAWRPVRFKDEAAVRAVVIAAFEQCPRRTGEQLGDLEDDLGGGCSTWCLLNNGRAKVLEIAAGPCSHPLYDRHAPMVALHRLSALVLQLQADESQKEKLAQHPDKRERTGRRISPLEGNHELESLNASNDKSGSHSASSLTAVRPSGVEVRGCSLATADSAADATTTTRAREGVKRVHPVAPLGLETEAPGVSATTVESQMPGGAAVATSPPCLWADGLFLANPDPPIDSTQYYAKGLTVFLDREPCVMCAMALLHSRVGCAVFRDEPRRGTVGGFTGLRLHASSAKLNHSFRVLQFKQNNAVC